MSKNSTLTTKIPEDVSFYYSSYVETLNDIENMIIVVACLITSALMSHLLFCNFFKQSKLRVTSFSKSMLVYMFTHVIFSFLSSLTTIYGFCIQDYYTVTGVVSIEYMSVEPIPVLFLTIERCISLKFPARNLRRLQNILFIFGILLMVVLASLGSALYVFPVTSCLSPSLICFLVKIKSVPQLYSKVFLCGINLIWSAYFFYLVRQIKTLHIGNNIVMVTLTLEIFLIILPAYSSLLYNLITGKTTASFLGSYVTMFCMIQVCCCSIIYSWIFLKRKKSTNISSSQSQLGHTPELKSRNALFYD